MAKLTQGQRILALLREAGSAGVTNRKLNEISFRYSARIHTLRGQGYQIEAVRVKDSLWKFILRGDKQWLETEPADLKLPPKSFETTPTTTRKLAQRADSSKPQQKALGLTLSWQERQVQKGPKLPVLSGSVTAACRNCGLSWANCKCSMWEKR